MKRQQGMTLLELLIAVAVFAILAALAYGGLNVVLSTSRIANDEAERLADVQRVLARIGADVEQMANRPVRDTYGDVLDAVVSDYDEAQGSRLEFTRHGRQNPAAEARSSLQRVAYRLSEDKILRESWAVLDRAQDTLPYEADMLDGVKRFEVRFIDSNGESQETWQTDVTASVPLPSAVEVILELEDWGEIRRLYRVAI
jgi:general secretion pathway protein J